MTFMPKPLFETTLDFVSANVEFIDCLIGFPEDIGKQIFNRFLTINENALLPSNKQVTIIRKFVNAYKILVLESINLSEKLILLNEYFDSFVLLFSHISELCLCSCFLGDNHEIFEQFQNFTLVKKLCLRRNCLKDGAIRKITLPVRMFNKGCKNIENLDLSENNCSNAVATWLSAFHHLTYLDISGSNITNKGLQEIEKKCSLQLCNVESNAIHPIVKKGWAAPLIEKWDNFQVSRREARKTREFTSYFKKIRYAVAEEKISAMNSSTKKIPSMKLIFRRKPHIESNSINAPHVVTKNPSHKLDYGTEIEEDIFSQYMKH
ncbi:hypothetical protein JTE90_017304 [Oedothorax gibbosus]|uniref:Leucine-rich repeat-containing protein 42 n=1 Tax=Oedothorax gibbosus TaxID=931172 RepID=A0AAV6UB32_9ARAC|nr:hypothetical protein JTE90_017304 [Oedothorax gibbosus]